MTKRYNRNAALGLGDMTPDMTKQQKDAVERATDAKMEQHFRSHRDVPNGRNFHTWEHTHDPVAEDKYRKNFDKVFPNSPGAGL